MQIYAIDFAKFMQNGTKKATSRLLMYSLFNAAELSCGGIITFASAKVRFFFDMRNIDARFFA